MTSKRHLSILGIALEDGRITAAVIRNKGGRLEIERSVQAPLTLDPLRNDPELVGREIRNHLSDAGMRERHCVVCLPLSWALSLRIDVPALSPEDTEDFLRTQADREFPFPIDDLALSTTCYDSGGEGRAATIVAIPKNQIAALQSVLKAAKLHPVSMTLGITALSGSTPATCPPSEEVARTKEPSEGQVSLLVRHNGLDLRVAVNGATVALRSLDETVQREAAGGNIDVNGIVRELRITLAQLPAGLRMIIREAVVFGTQEMAEPLALALVEPFAQMGLVLETGTVGLSEAFSTPENKQLYPAPLAAAGRYVLGFAAELEFLPPKIGRIKQLSRKVSSRVSLWLAAAAIAIVVVGGGALLAQHLRLSYLESKWGRIETNVAELKAIQERIKEFRPWYDDVIGSLKIVQSLAEQFPESGDVSAKNLDIRDGLSLVTCKGSADSNDDWMEVLDRLRKTDGIEDLQFQQITGESPLQFGLGFKWSTKGSHGN